MHLNIQLDVSLIELSHRIDGISNDTNIIGRNNIKAQTQDGENEMSVSLRAVDKQKDRQKAC